ncbi:MAG: MauE/DoxX family redox-associated membrane protein [Dehalococcoidia bacterium]|nr:MauE/DoxX family redox-associated membrane protein [Dehalococcoidia bacterium]
MKIEGRWNTVAIGVLAVLRVALGALFIISAFAKLQHPDLFIDAVQNYHLLPESLGSAFGTALPWAELFVGCSLALGIFPTFTAALSIPMILSFVVANVASFFKDVGEACGCLGNLVNMSHTTSLIVDFVMLAVSGLLIYQRKRAGVVGVGQLLRWQKLRLPRAAALALGAVIIAVAMVLTYSQVPQQKSPWKESLDDALKDDRVVVMCFWEGEVEDIYPVLAMYMDLRERYGGAVDFNHVDCGQWDDAAAKFDVTDFPTILIIEDKNSKGYVVYPERFRGAEDREALVTAIDEVLAR